MLRALVFLTATLLFQTVTAGNDVVLTHVTVTREVFNFGNFALYVPCNLSSVRGIILALGGPDTRAFASHGSFGAPSRELEAALEILGKELRTLAASHGLALLGTSLTKMVSGPESDDIIFQAVREAAARSGRPELASAPLLLYGISGGGPQASGFTMRNPERITGLFMKVPARLESLSSPEVLAVPTYIVLAERDTIVDSRTLIAAFETNRGAGALWAMAMEPGVAHHSLTPSQRAITTNWMRAVVELRLGASDADRLREVTESSGWLGHSDIGVAQWANYPGDRRSASWFPSQTTAEEWKAFVGKKDVR